MRILHFIHSLNPAHGGTTYGLRGLVEELLRLGHETEIIVLDDAQSEWMKDWPCPVHACGSGWRNYGWNLRFLWNACHRVRSFDHVLVHGLWQFHGISAWAACSLAGVPYAVFPHGMLDGWFAKAYPTKHRIKKLYWRLFEHRILRDASTVFFTTREELEAGRGTFSPFNAKPSFAAFGVCGPEESRAHYSERWKAIHPALAKKRIVLFLGRIHSKKGCDLMIQAGAQWLQSLSREERSEWHLRIVGPCEDGSYLESLQNMAVQDGLLPNIDISFAPAVAGDEKWSELCAADALILPSHQENFGVIIAEALACGTPVLISDKVNGWKAIESAGAALTAPDDLCGTRSLFEKWAKLSFQQREAMKVSGVNFFESRMSAKVSAKALLERLAHTTNSNESNRAKT